MNQGYSRPGFWGMMSPVIKNLVIINTIMLIATWFIGDTMYEKLALFAFESPFFKPYQLITHMFMHGDFWHLFFNMYTLMIFGTVLERIWGSKKFLLFYFVTGIGAALCHSLVLHLQYDAFVETGKIAAATAVLRTPTVGASGAIYGVLLGYGMLFPDNRLQLIFPPVAMKAKWFVIIFGAIELITGLTGMGGNIAHFAHLGGMLFGLIMILIWKKQNRLYH
ncbi:MAG: rhomboid family intramembrane serine protease [Bacteroidales bacterium]|jgi:membrane associated rhomboid family serine protease|nr:rhomboid family intramembrane serine protease [Bacteroidales bacterium]